MSQNKCSECDGHEHMEVKCNKCDKIIKVAMEHPKNEYGYGCDECYADCDGETHLHPNCSNCDKLVGFVGNPEVELFGTCLCRDCAILVFTQSQAIMKEKESVINEIKLETQYTYMGINFREFQ